MADNVGVSTGTGATIAAENIASVEYQRVKLVAGDITVTTPIGATSGVPSAASVGLIVAVIPGVSVSAQVSGNVTVVGTVTDVPADRTTAPPSVSMSGGAVWIAGGQSTTANPVAVSQVGSVLASVVPGVSVTIVGETVQIQSIVPVTTAASVSVSALPVWLNPTQTIAVSGLLFTTAGPSISMSGIPVWIAGGQSTQSTPVFVSQINPPAAGGGSVTTAVPSISASGQIMWVVGGQSTTAAPVFVSQINPPSGAGGGSVTSSAPSITASGQVIWVAGGQSTTVNPVYVSQLANTLGTLTAVIGISNVTNIASIGTVTAIVGVSNVTNIASIGTVTAIVGVSNITLVMNATGVTTAASVSVTGIPVWLNPTQQVVAVPTLQGGYVNAIVTTSALSSSTRVMLMSVYNSTGSTLGTSGWTIGAGSALVVYGLGFGWSQAAANMQATFMLLVTNSGTTLSTVSPAWAQVTFSTGVALTTFLSTGFVPGGVVGVNSSITNIGFPLVIPGPAVVGVAVAATSSGATVYASIQAAVVNSIPFTEWFTPGISVTIAGQTVQIQSIAPVTTAASVSVSGFPIWINPTQPLGNLNTLTAVLGVSNITNVLSVGTVTAIVGVSNVTNVASVGTVTAVVGVSNVTLLLNATGVTTAASVSVTGIPVWLNPTQQVVVSGLSVTTAVPSISASGLVVWLAGGQSTQATPVFVSQINPPAGGGGSVTTLPPSITATGQIMWVVGGQSTSANPVFVSQINPPAAGGGSVTTSAPSISASGQVVWMAGGQSTTAFPVFVSQINPPAAGGGSVTTSAPSISASGQVVWIAGGQSTSAFPVLFSQVSVIAGGYLFGIVTSTAMSSSTRILLMSVYNSTGSTLGTSGWTIGAGSVLVINDIGFGWSQAAANMQVTFFAMVTTSGATLSTIATAWAQVTFSTGAALTTFISSGWTPGGVIGINSSITVISLPFYIPGPAVFGLAMAATSSGGTVYASINATITPTLPIIQPVTMAGFSYGFTTASAGFAATATALMVVATGTMGIYNGTTVVSGLVTAQQSAMVFCQLAVSLTAGASSGSTVFFTVYTGASQITAGTSAWPVPAGLTFRLLRMEMAAISSGVGALPTIYLVGATAAGSLTLGGLATLPVFGVVNATSAVLATSFYSAAMLQADIPAGVTLGIIYTVATSFTIANVRIYGVLY